MENTYTIQELSELSGVPRRNIHFYTQQGILPPPQGAGLGARYSQAHLLRLQAIPVLRRQGLRLDEIRKRLDGADLAMLSTLATPPAGQDRAPIDFLPGPVPAGRTYVHYSLPSGLTLVVPPNLNPEDRRRVDALLDAARRIFSTSPRPYATEIQAETGDPGEKED